MASDSTLLRGSFRILFLYDVAEAIDLEKLRSLLGARAGTVEQGFPRRTPEYVRFEHPPVVEPGECLTVGSAGEVGCPIKYYPFGVVVVQVRVPFECDWNSLLAQASRWMDTADIEPSVRDMMRKRLEHVIPAVVRLNSEWLQETYLVTEIHEVLERGSDPLTASELSLKHGEKIVQLVRGEQVPIAPKAIEETLQASLSYYPWDLVVIGSYSTVVFDRAEDADATAQVLEHAKMQLLEFRYYDKLMTQVLSDFYGILEQKRNILFSRWSLPRDANRLNTIRLDVMDLSERIDNAIKFVSDIYYARVYRQAATRIGVPDYRNLVDQKLRTAGDLYDFTIDQFNETRSFFLEVVVAILVALDVILVLKGK